MAKTKEEKIKNISDYRLANYRQFIFCVNKTKEADMLEYIEAKRNFAGYLKGLIKEDMNKNKKNVD
jgi:hypothetical protein